MNHQGEWIPPNAPLDESYWEALLRDGENGRAVPTITQMDLRDERVPPTSEGATTVTERWQQARDLMEQKEMLELSVVGYNRGGLLVEWNDIPGFVPASHLSNLSSSVDGNERHADLQRFVGAKLRLKIIEMDLEHRRLILSERATHIDENQRNELWDRLCPGDICQGRVTNLCSFGAFVDLGGFEGLVHISELSWGRVEHPSDVLEPGQLVEVYVLNVDRKRERVGLSIKRLQPDPWQSVQDLYQAGQIVEGAVTHIVKFGAFVEVDEGLEGLIHISELTGKNSPNPDDVVQKGDLVTVQILNVDSERRRIGLRLEQINRKSELPTS
jgi:small subunit ribosomal protein S1